jgi:hypothetical protein
VCGTNARNSLYSYLYLKVAKCYVLIIISCVFFSTKLKNRFCLGTGVGGEVAQTMSTYMNKYKNDKIKKELL